MTKEIMKYLLSRYHYINAAIENGNSSVFLKLGNRKERISIDSEVKKFSDIVRKALNCMKDDFSRNLMRQCAFEGRSDVNIFTHNKLTKGSYYRIKKEFTDTLFLLCTSAGLVSEEDILESVSS